jgi:hypothetical protein
MLSGGGNELLRVQQHGRMAEPVQSARKRMGSGDLVPEPTGASPAASVGAVRRTPPY